MTEGEIKKEGDKERDGDTLGDLLPWKEMLGKVETVGSLLAL